jgi:hypothetical protein
MGNVEADALDRLKTWTIKELLPKLLNGPYFIGAITGYLYRERNRPKRDWVQAYRVAVAAVVWSLAEGFDDEPAGGTKGFNFDGHRHLTDEELDAWVA